MEITVFGRTIRFFTPEQINKLKNLILRTIGDNSWYRFAVFCFFLYLVICIVCRIQRKKGKDPHKLRMTGFFLYVVFLLSALVLSRPAGERSMIAWDRNFFMTERVFHETSLFMVLMKFCMSVPFGVSIKRAFDKTPTMLLAVGAALTGIFIECMKYFWGRGRAAIGSAILLSAGTLIGICFESILIKLRNFREEK